MNTTKAAYINVSAQGSKPLSRSFAPSALIGWHVTVVAAQLTLERITSTTNWTKVKKLQVCISSAVLWHFSFLESRIDIRLFSTCLYRPFVRRVVGYTCLPIHISLMIHFKILSFTTIMKTMAIFHGFAVTLTIGPQRLLIWRSLFSPTIGILILLLTSGHARPSPTFARHYFSFHDSCWIASSSQTERLHVLTVSTKSLFTMYNASSPALIFVQAIWDGRMALNSSLAIG